MSLQDNTTPITSSIENKDNTSIQMDKLFMQAPVGFAFLKGPIHIINRANPAFLKLTGRDESIIGKSMLDVFTEIESQGYLALLNNVLQSHEPLFLNESPVTFLKEGVRVTYYISTVLQPYFEGDAIAGVLSILSDVTPQVFARKKVEESEERLRLAIQATHLGTWEFLPLTGKLTWSNECRKIYQFPLDKEVDYELFLKHIYPDDAAFAQAAIAKAMDPEGSGTYDIEYRILRYTDRKVVWIRAHGKVFFNEDKQPVKFIGTVFDITDRKEKEKILKESTRKYELIADAVPHMVWEIELDGTISYINKQWANWSGLTLAEINAGGWGKVFHPEDADLISRGWAEAFENKKMFTGECRIKNPEGGYTWFTLKTVPVTNNKGEVELWIGTATDVHAKKISEQQKDQFITIASHELKTPVTTIKAYGQLAEMMLKKTGNTEALGMIQKMGAQVNKLTDLIEDLLDVSKIQQGKLVYTKAVFDFNMLAKEVIDDMQKSYPDHKMETKIKGEALIAGDREKLSQVINNLISNAVKYSPGAKRIVITAKADKKHVELSVKDFGIGISKHDQQHIFEQFYRAGFDGQSTFPGMGIGLFICTEIVTRHNGEIWVESKPGKGSTFYISLPVNG